MLKFVIKPTFQNTAPKDVRWLLSFMPSSFLPYNWARNRKIHITFYSRCLTSCRIFRKCIFIISSRGYITCPDRWPGSHVSAGYRSSCCKLSLYLARVPNGMQLYWRDTQFRTKEISPPRHLGLCPRLLSLPSCAKSESACQFSLLKIDISQDLNTLNGAAW